MPKVGMGPVRRQQLVEATIATINTHGLADTTVTRIARTAGLSPGIVHHYFADKDELLFETMRQMLAQLRTDTLVRLARAKTPANRLEAITAAALAPKQFSRETTTAWLALYASAAQSFRLTRILALYHRRLKSNLIDALKHSHLPADNVAETAETIAALIDGLYLRAALNPSLYDDIDPLTLARHALKQVAP